MADFQAIQLTIENQVAWITLNRPDARNAVNDDMREELLAVLTDARTNADMRAVVLTGAGKGFCTGADLSRRGSGPTGPGAAREMMRTRSQRLIRALWELEKPIIAAVNGVAAGLGAHLAFACDLIIAVGGRTLHRGLRPARPGGRRGRRLSAAEVDRPRQSERAGVLRR